MRSIRLSRVLVGAAFACLLSTGAVMAGGAIPVPPEQTTGSVGESLTRDGPLSTAATCKYSDTQPLKLRRISVASPEVRWADTDSENDFQHGKVGFRIIVQRSTDSGASWSKYRVSTQQLATAYENTPAPLTKRVVDVSVPGAATVFRVYSRVTWYKPNGAVRGTLKHWYAYARYTSDQLQGTIESGNCLNKPT